MLSNRIWSLLNAADDLSMGQLTWTARGDAWQCRCSLLRFPHVSEGGTPADALDELVRFVRRVMR